MEITEKTPSPDGALRGTFPVTIALAFILLTPCFIPGQMATGNEAKTLVTAKSLLFSGNWLLPESAPDAFSEYPPLLYWLLALFSFIAGGISVQTGILLSAGSAALILYSSHRTIKQAAGSDRAFFSLLLLAGSFSFLTHSASISPVILFALFAVLFLNRFYRWQQTDYSGKPLNLILYASAAGLSGGLLAQALLHLISIAYTAIADERRQKLKGLAVSGVTALLSIIVPVAWGLTAAGISNFNTASSILLSPGIPNVSGHSHKANFLIPGLLPWLLFLIPLVIGSAAKIRTVKLPSISQIKTAVNNWLAREEPANSYGLFSFLVVIILVAGSFIPGIDDSLLFAVLPYAAFLVTGYAWSKLPELLGQIIYPILSISLSTLVGFVVFFIAFLGGPFKPLVEHEQALAIAALALPLGAAFLLCLLQSYRVWQKRHTLSLRSAFAPLTTQYSILVMLLVMLIIPLSRTSPSLLLFAHKIPENKSIQMLHDDQHEYAVRLIIPTWVDFVSPDSLSAEALLVIRNATLEKYKSEIRKQLGKTVAVSKIVDPEKESDELLLLGSEKVLSQSTATKPASESSLSDSE